jgi:hypothetical protein
MNLVRSSLGRRVDGETLSSGGVELSLSLGDRWSAGLGADTVHPHTSNEGTDKEGWGGRARKGMEEKTGWKEAKLPVGGALVKAKGGGVRAYTVTESQSDMVGEDRVGLVEGEKVWRKWQSKREDRMLKVRPRRKDGSTTWCEHDAMHELDTYGCD